MSRLHKCPGLPNTRSGIPRPIALQTVVQPTETAAEARRSGSVSATSEVIKTKTSTQPSKGRRISTNSTHSVNQPSQSGTTRTSRSSTVTKQVQSKAKVTITKPTGEKRIVVKQDKESIKRETDPLSEAEVESMRKSKKPSSAVSIPSSSLLRKQVALHLKGQVAKAPMGSKVTAVATKKIKVPPLDKIMTPVGPQKVVQKIITEKRVERSKHGEMIAHNIKTIETNPGTGETIQIEEEFQQLNPDYPAREGPLKEIVTIVSEKDITENFETRKENTVLETIKLDADVGIESAEVVRLVEEEKEDVENVLRLSLPELVNQAPTLYPLKKRLDALRLSPENIVMIEKSVINPPVTADEVLLERTPELIAQVMEISAEIHIPNVPSRRMFDSLFGLYLNNDSAMIVSSATPGPLRDVVVPTTVPKRIHEEMLSKRMEEASIIVQTGSSLPPKDNFVVAQPSKPRKRARRKLQYTPIALEDPPWDDEDKQVVIQAVGALPKNNVITKDIQETKKIGKLNKALVRGIEYVLEADYSPYHSRVQLRGSQPPSWFPGYMMALSDTSNIVEIAKSPSQVLFSAWKSVQPDTFPDDSILYN